MPTEGTRSYTGRDSHRGCGGTKIVGRTVVLVEEVGILKA